MSDIIYQVMKESIDSGSTSGVNLLVIKNGVEQCYCEYGYRDLENRIPMSRDTIFRMYSQTKPITAAAAMLLTARGKIDLTANVSEYLPEYANPYVNVNGSRVPSKKEVQVRDLLHMTSGYSYPDNTTFAGRQAESVFEEIDKRLYTENAVTTSEFASMMAKTDLNFHPGEHFQYGTSADIMGALIEKVTDMRFGEFLKKEFLEPLEMVDTDFYVPKEKQFRLAKTYDYCETGLCECRTNHLGLRYMRDIPPAFESGGAGLCSTLDDYSHFTTMLMNMGEYKGRRIMPEAAVKHMIHGGLTPAQMQDLHLGWDCLTGYSYGNFMRVCVDESETVLFSAKGEYGWDGWLGTFFSNDPKNGLTTLIGLQQAGHGRAGTLMKKLKNVVMSEFT
ncbi:MAG: beta-lactamase family protein [Lachnospiraceae bacterium]|nr:beta-lactamase family protein [Lachnospiraceae bacterium]